MQDKKQSRLRRARKVRGNIARLGAMRLAVHRTPRHFYAQLFDASGENVVASISTLDAKVRDKLKYGGNITAASEVGKFMAEKVKQLGAQEIAFDRSGFRYHGRVKAFAEAARAGGLKF